MLWHSTQRGGGKGAKGGSCSGALRALCSAASWRYSFEFSAACSASSSQRVAQHIASTFHELECALEWGNERGSDGTPVKEARPSMMPPPSCETSWWKPMTKICSRGHAPRHFASA